MKLQSSAFGPDEMIPSRYTIDGADVSPPLKWSGAPSQTKSFVLICDDPDAPGGNWDHWLLFNIPPDMTELQEQFILQRNRARGIRGGTNDFGSLDYGGPAPPSGTHRYVFKIFALDTMLALREGVRKKELLQAMEGHIITRADLTGKYARKR